MKQGEEKLFRKEVGIRKCSTTIACVGKLFRNEAGVGNWSVMKRGSGNGWK